MDPEKSAAWTGREGESDVDKISRAQHHNNDLPSWAATQDPEKNGEFGQSLHTPQRDLSRNEDRPALRLFRSVRKNGNASHVQHPPRPYREAMANGKANADRPRSFKEFPH